MCEFRFVLLAATLSFAACVPSLNQQAARAARTTTPDQYPQTQTQTNTASVAWGEFFKDDNLAALIDAALENNQELAIVGLEIEVAKNEITARNGEYLPRLDFRAGAGIEKVGKYTSQGAADEANEVPEHLQDYFVGFFASWEVDIWKKLRNASKAATYRYMASIEGRKFLVTRLVAEIADAYYELVALDNQLAVLEQNVTVQQDALEVVRLQKEAARATELAVQRFEAEVFKNQSRRYEVRQRIIETENRINFLLGRFPRPIVRSKADFRELTPRVVDAGLPAQLLANRPDVREAELRLEAAKLDVEVAKARFYPSLELRGGVGYQAFRLGHFFATPESLLYNLFADVMAPIFNRNALEAGYFSANAQQMQAVHAYERTIVAAYSEVANQLAMVDNLDKSYTLRAQEVQRLEAAIDVSATLFESARADYMEVLLTRRDALESKMELIETKKRQMGAMVNLYQALGGGWSRERVVAQQ